MTYAYETAGVFVLFFKVIHLIVFSHLIRPRYMIFISEQSDGFYMMNFEAWFVLILYVCLG